MRLKVFFVFIFFNEVINLNTKWGCSQLGERLDGIQKVVGSIPPSPPLGEKHEMN